MGQESGPGFKRDTEGPGAGEEPEYGVKRSMSGFKRDGEEPEYGVKRSMSGFKRDGEEPEYGVRRSKAEDEAAKRLEGIQKILSQDDKNAALEAEKKDLS